MPSCTLFHQFAGRRKDKLPVTNPSSIPLPSASCKNAGNQVLSVRTTVIPSRSCLPVSKHPSRLCLLAAPSYSWLALLQALLSSEFLPESQAQPASLHFKWNSGFVAVPACHPFYSLLNRPLGSNLQVLAVFSFPWLQTSLVALFGSPLGFLLKALSFSSLQ